MVCPRPAAGVEGPRAGSSLDKTSENRLYIVVEAGSGVVFCGRCVWGSSVCSRRSWRPVPRRRLHLPLLHPLRHRTLPPLVCRASIGAISFMTGWRIGEPRMAAPTLLRFVSSSRRTQWNRGTAHHDVLRWLPRYGISRRRWLQPAAHHILGHAVRKMSNAGSYDCRGERGGRPQRLSQHSFGRAIDITGFELDNGTTILGLARLAGPGGEKPVSSPGGTRGLPDPSASSSRPTTTPCTPITSTSTLGRTSSAFIREIMNPSPLMGGVMWTTTKRTKDTKPDGWL